MFFKFANIVFFEAQRFNRGFAYLLHLTGFKNLSDISSALKNQLKS